MKAYRAMAMARPRPWASRSARCPGLFRWRMLVQVPNLFFLSMAKSMQDAYRFNYELFLDVKPW